MTEPTAGIRTVLRDRVRTAIRDRDQEAVRTLRVALSAIDNAEAVPDRSPLSSGAIEHAPVGVGSTEAPRRVLDERQMRELVTIEALSLRAAADGLGPAHSERAGSLRRQADLLQAIVAELEVADRS